MRNPYAKLQGKRPRQEKQKPLHDTNATSAGGGERSSSLVNDNRPSVPQHQVETQQVHKASCMPLGYGSSSLFTENRTAIPQHHAQTQQIQSVAASHNVERGLQRPIIANPYQKASKVTEKEKSIKNATVGSVIVPKPQLSSTITVTVGDPLSLDGVSPQSARMPVPAAVKPVATLATNVAPARPATLSIPRPTSWASSAQPAAIDAATSKPSLSNRSVSSHTLSMPRPPTWARNSAATALSVNSVASRPSSSQGQADGLPVPLNYSPERVKPLYDEYRQRLVKNAKLSAPLLNGWTLFSHQKKALLRALLMRRFILALDMGLGKTLIGCVWAKAFQQTYQELTILVVCPVTLKAEWKRTAEEATGLQVDDAVSMQICSWAKVPSAPTHSNFVVIFDEAHMMQSMTAARTKESLELVRNPRCVGVLMLTGTPLKNGKPLNLFPLLKAANHPFGAHQTAYETYFCAGQTKQFGRGREVWDASGSSNLPQLRQHVASHLLYMTKEECLDELPPQTRVFRQVPVSSRHQLQHNLALNDLAKVYNTSGSLEKNGDLILTAVQRVRQIGSFAKIDATVALAKEVLLDQPAVVIFTSFVTVAKSLHKQLSESGWEGEVLTGETPQKKRQGMVDNFQAGLSPVFILTFGAGGVGLTLTAAHTIILLDRPWTPGEAQQAEDRVRRIGQTKPVTSIWMVAFDLDKQIDSVLEQKQNTSSVVLKEGNDDATAAAPKISIFALLKTLLVNKEYAPLVDTTTQPNGSTEAERFYCTVEK